MLSTSSRARLWLRAVPEGLDGSEGDKRPLQQDSIVFLQASSASVHDICAAHTSACVEGIWQLARSRQANVPDSAPLIVARDRNAKFVFATIDNSKNLAGVNQR